MKICEGCKNNHSFIVNWKGCELCDVGMCRSCMQEKGRCEAYEQGEIPDGKEKGKIIACLR